VNIGYVETIVGAVIVITYVFVTLYVAWNADPFTYLTITIITVSIIMFINNLFRLLRAREVTR
jgi:uncharacterized membrane protein